MFVGTREQKCERVKALGAVLGKVESLVTDEYNKYRETFDSYVRERDGYMQGRGEMGTLMTNATMESEELSRMMEENKGNETDMTMMDSAMDGIVIEVATNALDFNASHCLHRDEERHASHEGI